MPLILLAVLVMSGAAIAIAQSATLATSVAASVGVWLVFCAVTCALSAIALAGQPLGEPTLAGTVGSQFMHWGWNAGRGQLAPAALISWLVWAVLGTAIIVAVRLRGELSQQLLVLAWAIDLFVLMHAAGIVLERRSASMFRGLAPVAATLVALILVSAIQSIRPLLPGGQRTALLIAGGPPLFVGGAYGLFLAVTLTLGRFLHWN